MVFIWLAILINITKVISFMTQNGNLQGGGGVRKIIVSIMSNKEC